MWPDDAPDANETPQVLWHVGPASKLDVSESSTSPLASGAPVEDRASPQATAAAHKAAKRAA